MPGKPDRLAAFIPPLPRLLWGMALIPLLLFQHRWEAQLFLSAGCAALAIQAGKRINFGYFLVMAGSITLFNLITPYGQVLFRIGPWAITEGALSAGIGKGIGIAGLVFISLFSVSRELRIPGRFGGLLTQTFVYYEQLLQEKKSLQAKALVISIDRLLERLYQPGPRAEVSEPAALADGGTPHTRTKPAQVLTWWGVLLIAGSLGFGIILLF